MAKRRAHWTLDDIPWGEFDPSKVDAATLSVVKTASLVEYNGGSYAVYLRDVFHDDPAFQAAATKWALEEQQHGEALARWSALADPSYDFESSFKKFADQVRLPQKPSSSVRGSRCGELVARCMVEVGTSSYYTAIGEATEEPVLRAICRRVAADELRHYKLFYSYLKRYQKLEGVGFWRRLTVALSRIGETEDDELAYAYFAANPPSGTYNRRRANRAYMSRAYSFYRLHHMERGVAMIFKALGLPPYSWLRTLAARLGFWFVRNRTRRLIAASG